MGEVDLQEEHWTRQYQETRRPYWPDETLERWLHTLPKREGKALELGCGSGRNLVALAHAGFFPCGIDQSEEAIRLAARRLREYHHGLEAGGGDLPAEWGELKVGRIGGLPWPDGHFQVVAEVNVLEHVFPGERQDAVKEAYRVLAPGGQMFLRMISGPVWGIPAQDEARTVYRNDGTRLHWFNAAEVAMLLARAGLGILHLETETKSLLGRAPRSEHWVVWATKHEITKVA